MKNLFRGLAILTLSGIYLYALPSPTISYYAIVLLHSLTGLVLSVGLVIWFWRHFRQTKWAARLGWLLVTAGAGVGVALIITGTLRALNPLWYAHIGLSATGVILLIVSWLRANPLLDSRPAAQVLACAGLILAVAAVAGSAWWTREVRWQRAYVIRNPEMPPATMNDEGDGPAGSFFPSSAQTLHGGKIPAKFFMQSDACKRCHADIYAQWSSSVHHFSSFNNQWYRKSIEYMQEVAGVQQSKWCAGCHDPALLFSGMFDTPIKDQVNSPEAQAGMGCMMCHTIVNVKSTMGQGDYILEYPKMHELASTKN